MILIVVGDLAAIYSRSINPHLFRSFHVLILLEALCAFKDDLFAVIHVHNVASPDPSSSFLIIAGIAFNTHVAIYSISNDKISKPTNFSKVPVSLNQYSVRDKLPNIPRNSTASQQGLDE
jgi:hypothetical protein